MPVIIAIMNLKLDFFNIKNNQHLKIGINNPLKMAAHKTASRKKRLLKHIKQNRPVPAWVIIRTHRNVRTNPKRRAWRRTDVNVG
jgi:large subunit ribosomal protein L39e